MLGRAITAFAVAAAITSAAFAQDVKWPEINFGRFNGPVIDNNDYQHLRRLKTAVGDATRQQRSCYARNTPSTSSF